MKRTREILEREIDVSSANLEALATETAQRKRQLERLNVELRRLDRLRSEFTTMVTHELRTPLTAIKEGVELVLDGIGGPVTEDQKHTLEITRNNIQRLSRLVHNVLNFARIESGRVDLSLQHADLRALLGEVSQLMATAAKRKNLSLSCEVPDFSVLFDCDTDKIMQILINLLDNAIKFTEPGGRIWLRLGLEGKWVKFEVEDTGIGIRKEDQDKIFEMFGQCTNAQGMWQTGGAGIGLAICKKLAELHKGKIQVQSAIGQGTKFIVFLPMTAKKAA